MTSGIKEDEPVTDGTTPRPWHVHEKDCCGVIYGPIADGSPHVAEVFAASSRESDRDLICAAVNAYDRLRAIEAAATALRVETFGRAHNDEDIEAAWDTLREALDAVPVSRRTG